jgi:(p)ppGpp synthase/HD superfamily hydrolase
MELTLIEEAVLKASEYHGEQKRKFSDELYIDHCLRVASLVGDYSDNEDLVIAAILHDIVEDTLATVNDINIWFGDKVSSLVEELTNDDVILKSQGKRIYIAEKFNTLSEGGLIIKSLDRLDNLTGLINSSATLKFVKNYVDDTDYLLDNIDRDLLPVHKILLHNLTFINNYVALTTLR